VLRSLRDAFRQLRRAGDNSIDSVADDIIASISDLEDIECDDSRDVQRDLERSADDLKGEARTIEDEIADAKSSFSEFLAFVKTFDKEEFSSIYCEREWRSIKPFFFTVDDLAMIVLPKGGKGTSYFDDFVNGSTKLPKSIPIVPWEDLVEH
jgi:hypothetical protein